MRWLKKDWHGMLQNGTAYMDGVPGFTQVSFVSISIAGHLAER
jgi:hypothetical protein